LAITAAQPVAEQRAWADGQAPAPHCIEGQGRQGRGPVGVGGAGVYKNFQIPPDLVVKSQGVDIIGLILPLIRGQNVVETSRRHMKSRFELLSPSKGNLLIVE